MIGLHSPQHQHIIRGFPPIIVRGYRFHCFTRSSHTLDKHSNLSTAVGSPEANALEE